MTTGLHRSLWLQQALGDAPDEPALAGSARADVAIVGGGYVGLWTAILIKEQDPGCDVVILEGDVCGGGASGRNGGFVLGWWPKLATLVALCGEEEAVRLCRAADAAVAEIGAFCAEHGIDADYTPAGHFWTATTRATLGAWDEAAALARSLGAADAFEAVDPAALSRRTGSDRHLDGVFERHGATVQPARLVRGLRRVALERGVRIHEHTEVTDLDRRSPAVLRAAAGAVTAERVVIATNARAASLRELWVRLVAISSDVVATEPIPDRLAEIGWTGGEAISDSQQMVHYYRTTADGRIAFGKGGWGIALAGRIPPSFDRHDGRAADVEADFRAIYPALAGVAISHHWSGPIDRSPSGIPLLGRLGGREHLLYGVGWSGNGVGPSRLGGKILASLALGRADEWSACGLVDTPRPGVLPPEPARYAGAHVVRDAVVRKERAERAGRAPRRIDVALAGLAPAGMIPNPPTE
jgi:putative aminophosphonate oxidoreductase